MSPQRIGDYRVLERLGEGGMGVVYRAVGADGREVALKVLRAALGQGPLVQRFEREARIRIDHPNVARVLDAGVAEGAPFIALELLDGETLAERFARGRSSPDEIASWGSALCAALAAAHAQRIVHRDIKPSNVFLCRDGSVKLLDFGVALVERGRERLTSPGAVPGTLGYLSPEQAQGQVAVDARSDIWSLGAVLYEGLTGRVPFERETPLATVVATLVATLVPVRELAPDTPPSLARAIERALSRDRDARYPSAQSFAAALTGTDASRTEPAFRAESIRPGERRVLALVLAHGLSRPDLFEAAVRDHGGALHPLLGDRALGIFGAERWEGGEVEHAARAALEAREAASAIAVASGWVGAEIAGAVLEAASRCVRPGLVTADPEAARMLAGAMPLSPIEEGVFALEGEALARGALDSDRIQLLDRGVETAQLEAALRTVLVDRAALVALICGPPGIGKSRLRAELEQRLPSLAPDAVVLSVAAASLDRDRDLSLARQMALAALGSPGEDVRAELGRALGRAGVEPRAVRRHAEALAGLISPARDRSQGAVDVALVRDRCRVALAEWLGALASRSPLALSIEDLHFADDASLEILEDAVDAATDKPLLVVATARAEMLARDHAPFAGREVVLVEPRNLSRADAGALAARVAGRALSDSILRTIAERSDGNPFFVVQLARALEGEDALAVPLTLEAAVQSRLDQLPVAERELCRRVSVWGRGFGIEEARALVAEDAEALLASLARRDLMSVRGRRGTQSFHLKPLIGGVCYRSLDEELRRELHGAAADWLAQAPLADAQERARHRELGGRPSDAALDYDLAARTAIRRGDAQGALHCADRALALGAPAIFELRALRVDALRFMGRKDEHGAALEAALQVARTDAERARVLGERALWLSRTGGEGAAEHAANASAAARASGSREELILARGREFLVLRAAGRARDAEAALAEVLPLSGSASPDVRAMVLGWRGMQVAARGDLGERLAVFAELAEVCDEIGDVRRAAGARANLADVYNHLGIYDGARDALEAALADCRRVGHRTMEGYVLLNLAYARFCLGDARGALEGLEQAGALAGSMGEARLAVLVRAYRARALMSLGAHADAEREAQAAASAASGAMPDLEVTALSLCARAKLALGDALGAIERSDRAYARYVQLDGMEEGEAEVFLARAEVLRACGRAAEALEVLRAGRARLSDLAAAIADAELRARFERDVAAHRELLGSAETD